MGDLGNLGADPLAHRTAPRQRITVASNGLVLRAGARATVLRGPGDEVSRWMTLAAAVRGGHSVRTWWKLVATGVPPDVTVSDKTPIADIGVPEREHSLLDDDRTLNAPNDLVLVARRLRPWWFVIGDVRHVSRAVVDECLRLAERGEPFGTGFLVRRSSSGRSVGTSTPSSGGPRPRIEPRR